MPILHKARYVEIQTWDAVQCLLCPHQCSIAPSRHGLCGVRSNRNGVLHCLTYGRVTDSTPVAIEDVPLFHYRPGTQWMRLASVGCTMHCPFCNTYRHSQTGAVPTRFVEPATVVNEAEAAGLRGLAFTLNEPAVWHEFLIDTAEEARKRGLGVTVATSGMWSTEPFAEAVSVVDAFLFGFKGIDSSFYTIELGGLMEQVRVNLEMAVNQECHVEASYLVIEGDTDTPEQVSAFGEWLSEVDPRIAVHVIGYKPDFQWNRPATSVEAVRKVAEALSERLPYVYSEEESQGLSRDTRCPSCNRVVISRSKVLGTTLKGLRGNHCTGCGTELPIRTEDPHAKPEDSPDAEAQRTPVE